MEIALGLRSPARRRRHWSWYLLTAGLVLLGLGALVLLYLLSNVGNLNINSTPSGAIIFLDGEQVHDRDGTPAKTPFRLRRIKGGPHDIELRLANHADWSKRIDVARDRDTPVNAVLEPFLCILHITCNIPDARVLIDQEPRGQCRDGHLTINGLPYGPFLLQVEHPRGWCEEASEAFTANQAKAALTINLKPKQGTLDINADQRGARVTIDGRPAGTVPLRRRLDYGQYQVRIEAAEPRFAPFEEVITLERPLYPIDAALAQINGRLIVTSEPAGAAVFLGEQELGPTPLDTEAPVGRQVLRVNFPRHREERREITIRQDAPTELHFALSPDPASLVVGPVPPLNRVPPPPASGAIRIESDPPGARVWVDGRPGGETPATIEELEPGFHSVELELANHLPASEEVAVEAGRATPFRATLNPYCASLRVETNPPDQVARYRVIPPDAEAPASDPDDWLGQEGAVRRWTPFVVNEIPHDQQVFIRLEISQAGQVFAQENFVRFQLGKETVITWDVTANPRAAWQIEYR